MPYVIAFGLLAAQYPTFIIERWARSKQRRFCITFTYFRKEIESYQGVEELQLLSGFSRRQISHVPEKNKVRNTNEAKSRSTYYDDFMDDG